MNILIACADSLMGRQMARTLACIRDGRDRTHPGLSVEGLYLFPSGASSAALAAALPACGAAFCLPESEKEHLQDWEAFSSALKACKGADRVFLAYGQDAFSQGVAEAMEQSLEELSVIRKAYVCSMDHPVGKWPGTDGNEAQALVRKAAAGDALPDALPDAPYDLTFAEDAAEALLCALERKDGTRSADGREEKGMQRIAPVAHRTSLKEIASFLETFRSMPSSLFIPSIPAGSLPKKLLSLYLAFLPRDQAAYPLTMRRDARGSFTELIKTSNHGQVSVNVSRPGVTKGEHWHHGKWELFIVVSGHGLIRERKIGTDEVIEFEVSGDALQAVRMLPGYTHSIVNLSDTENLVTVMWANEIFDPAKPDTFFEKV